MPHQRPDPQRFWEDTSPAGPASAAQAPADQRADVPTAVSPSYTYGAPHPASGPPARVGSAVAALICAVLTFVIPAFFTLVLGVLPFAVLVNVPGVALGIATLARTGDPEEVERLIAYTWGATILYLLVVALAVAGMVALLLTV